LNVFLVVKGNQPYQEEILMYLSEEKVERLATMLQMRWQQQLFL